jgi:tRNA 2-thiouridine synthesizing protein A
MAKNEKEEEVDSLVDCRGLYCPEPIFRLREGINELSSGQVLELIADDPAAESDVKRWAKNTGNKILKLYKDGFDLHVQIKKK